MIEIRFHGRGGQGAVTAASVLARAAGFDDKYAQGFPAFGVERRGAPVKAFCRISEKQINTRSQIYNPDYVIVLDQSLMHLPEITDGLKPESVIIVNGKQEGNPTLKQKAYFYDATSLALRILGKDIVNTAMLGVFAKKTRLVSLDSILKAVGENFSGKILELNTQLVKEAYNGS
ncbi:MAG: pyruvate ferredoxin oxidoreductase subunit gamma [Candidatus Aenigmarchaeota archaeon]|nr:pyruvate ferredoxin oxidoreductase subunit gamma [Candidatus Aenigmarchaeota archaeon]